MAKRNKELNEAQKKAIENKKANLAKQVAKKLARRKRKKNSIEAKDKVKKATATA